MFAMPAGLSEVVAFVAQPINLPIVVMAGAMTFLSWRVLRGARTTERR